MADTFTTVRVLTARRHSAELGSFSVPRRFDAEPGQFVMVWLPDLGERPFSISRLRPESMDITVRGVGPLTRALVALTAGDRVAIRGPFGRGFRLDELGRAPMLIAGGIGVAPIRFLAHELTRLAHPFRLCYGARTANDICHAGELLDLGGVLATDDGSAGRRGTALDLVRLAHLERPATSLIACGPEPMLAAVEAFGRDRGIPCQLSLERVMKCGMGICGECCMEGTGERLCVEGPVRDGVGVADDP